MSTIRLDVSYVLLADYHSTSSRVALSIFLMEINRLLDTLATLSSLQQSIHFSSSATFCWHRRHSFAGSKVLVKEYIAFQHLLSFPVRQFLIHHPNLCLLHSKLAGYLILN